jgi:GNAT superfamily N-acetyltransferase
MARSDGSTTHHAQFWSIFLEGALRYPWTWLTEGGEAASVWIPPGEEEMTGEMEERLAGVARRYLGPNASDYVDLLDRFEAEHPREQPHFYLSLLATHPDHRGHGIGMSLLRENLAMIDGLRAPAYLESSNPVNDRRYVELGFDPVGEISAPGGAKVTTMWRSVP